MAVVDGNGSIFSQPQYAAFGHGTMVAGIVHLVAPTAHIMPLKAFHADGTEYLSDVPRGAAEESKVFAAALLRSVGFSRRPDGVLVDTHGQPVEFSILSNPSNAQRAKIATIVQDDLAQLGMQVHVVPLEFQAMMARIFSSYDYEAAVPGLGQWRRRPQP